MSVLLRTGDPTIPPGGTSHKHHARIAGLCSDHRRTLGPVTTTLPGHGEGVSGSDPAAPVDSTPDEAPVELLLTPRDGVPPVIETAAALAGVVARFAAGSGPTAVDAE